MYVSFPGKLSEIHLNAWLFSNPCGKVLIIVGILWSLDLRVQLMLIEDLLSIQVSKTPNFKIKKKIRITVNRIGNFFLFKKKNMNAPVLRGKVYN